LAASPTVIHTDATYSPVDDSIETEKRLGFKRDRRIARHLKEASQVPALQQLLSDIIEGLKDDFGYVVPWQFPQTRTF
jgi:hypothetical protein